MKRLAFLIVLVLGSMFFKSVNIQAQCPNLNLSYGDFTNWEAYIGSYVNVPLIEKNSVIPGRHTIMNAQLLTSTGNMIDERCTGIPKVPTGFNYSAKLGSEAGGAEMEALSYELTVNSDNALLIVHFAFAMLITGHQPSGQPQFNIVIKDSVDTPISTIPCSELKFTSSQDLPEWKCKSSSFVARDWTTVGFSLEQFMGRTIKVYFETRDCAIGCHFGYAYIVAECRPLAIDLMYCSGQDVARLRAPDGFINYKWTRSGQPSWIYEGIGRNYKEFVLNDPIENEIFTCELTSELGQGCKVTLQQVIEKTSIAANFS